MPFLKKFIKLMKSELIYTKTKKPSFKWTIDESKCLSFGEVRKLRKTCNNLRNYGLQNRKFAPVRNWFMIELGLNTGLRVSEIASLKGRNLLTKRGRSSIVVIGKGNKKRAVWISSGFKEICKNYLNYKNSFGYSTNAEDYLLNNLKGTKITKRALQKIFKMILKKAKLSQHYYIHCLRHTYTTFLLDASNHNYRFAQKQLGHSSIQTTQTYASVLESKGRKAIEKMYL